MLRKTALGLIVAFVAGIFVNPPVQAQTLTTLHSFGGKAGQIPEAGVIRDEAGNFYGTAAFGGTFGWGVIFKLSPSGKETVLYSFTGKSDGAIPNSRLLRDKAGNFFGTTLGGGDPHCTAGTPPGCGVLFKFDTTTHKLVALYTFKGPPSDGEGPTDGLARGDDGTFYGATTLGGPSNSGTIFKLDPTNKETVLYSFTGGNGGPDGAGPTGVIRDSAGNLAGSTTYGGPGNTGIIFKLDSSGNKTILYTFIGKPDGEQPFAGLVQDSSGNLYGTTNGGGANGGGTVFKLDPSNKLTVLHTFAGADGGSSQAPVLLDRLGHLYGSTVGGGAYGEGVLFKLDPSGNETVLHSFQGAKDGDAPIGALLLHNGVLYGVTGRGGVYNWGMVFKITP